MSKQLRLWIIILGIAFFVFLCWYFSNITYYLIIALVLTMITKPLLTKMDQIRIKNKKIPHSLNALIVLLLIIILFLGFLFAFAPLIINQVNIIAKINFADVANKLRGGYSHFYDYIVSNGLEEMYLKAEHSVLERVQNFISLDKVGHFFSGFITATGSFFMAIFSIFFITFFFLKDNVSISKTFVSLIPYKNRTSFIETYNKIKNLLSRYFIGILCEIVIMMTLEIIGLSIFGIPNALLIGFLGGLFNIIPYLGPIIGATVGVILALVATMASGVYTGLGWVIVIVVSVFIVANLIDNAVLQPLIYSKSVKAHPIEIFLVIIMGGSIAGILGMFLAIPVYTVIRTIVTSFINNRNLIELLKGEDPREKNAQL
ncbi:MAG: AI-2E family transporter [Bacilli bacterium]|nr:AI-2E family transporter [Bacilli bacterium]